MAKKRQKSKITQVKLKQMLAKFKIRECRIKLQRLTISNNDEFRKALFEKYGIRNCAVRLNRLDEKDIPKVRPKLLPTGNVRSNSTISWFPSTSAIQKKSVDALSSLVAYQIQNGITTRVTGKKTSTTMPNGGPAKRQRAKSMYAPPKHEIKKKATMDDMHLELYAKYESPNRGLKSSAVRQLPDPQPKPVPDFQKIHDEFKAKLRAKQAKN